jgi:transketolase C-terminal domain/subunit
MTTNTLESSTQNALPDFATPEFLEDRIARAKSDASLDEIAYTGLSMTKMLLEAGERDPRVCFVGADTMDLEFQKRFPERAFDVGIAEQDQLGVATGLARSGMIPFVWGWAPFTPIRNFDQLRTSLARHNANVKIITTAAGLVNCSHGATHHDMESLSLFRVVPNLMILAPQSQQQFEETFHIALEHDGPVVIMGPAGMYAPGSEGLVDLPFSDEPVQIGKAQQLREGKDATIISFGLSLHYSWQAAERLEKEDGISVGIVNMFSLKPLDEDAIVEAARRTGVLLAVEEQSVIGGLGSAVAEVLAERGISARFKRLGIPDCFVENVGDWTETRQSIGLDVPGVMQAIKELRA